MLQFTPRDTATKAALMGSMAHFEYDRRAGYERLCQALKVRHQIDLASKQYGSRKRAAALLGLDNPSHLGNWATRGLPIERTPEVAARLDVDVYFILGRQLHMGRFGAPASSDLQDILAADLAEMKKRIEANH